MKKSIFICVLISVLLLFGCGHAEYHNLKADDAISEAVYEEMGDDVYYLGKSDNANTLLEYNYLIREENSELVYKITSVVIVWIVIIFIIPRLFIYLYLILGIWKCVKKSKKKQRQRE